MRQTAQSPPSLRHPLAAVLLLAFGCSAPEAHRGAGAGAGGDAEIACAKGEIVGASGECMAVGPKGCADLFLGPDRLCHPRVESCPKGQIPKLDEGCVPVGIARCAPAFLESDGLCHPSMDKCKSQPGTFPVPEDGCTPIDGPDGCGAGTWGAIADATGTLYVDPSAAAGGDGSKEKPFHAIADAMAAVADGGRIALAAGSYHEGVSVTKKVELVGRCPSMVRIDGTVQTDVANFPVVVLVQGPRLAVLRGLEIGGAGYGILAVGGASVQADHLHVREASYVGVSASSPGTTLSLSSSWIEDTLPEAGSPFWGRGANAEDGARLVLDKTAIVNSRAVGVTVGGGELGATSVVIEGTRQSAGQFGYGINAFQGGKVTLTASALVSNQSAGIAISDGTTQLTATGNLVEGTIPDGGDPASGFGVLARRGARASLSGNAIVKNHHGGLFTVNASTTVESRGDLIASTIAQPTAPDPDFGAAAEQGAQLTLTSSAVIGNPGAGLIALGAGSAATLTASLIQGTLPEPDQSRGEGVNAAQGAQLRVVGSAIVDSTDTGVLCGGDATTLSIDASLVEGTLPAKSDRAFGRGVEVDHGPTLSMDGSVIVGNHDAGIFLGLPMAATVTHSLIEETVAQESDGEYGVGVFSDTTHLMLSDTVLSENRVAGLIVVGVGDADVARVRVDGVLGGQFSLINPAKTLTGIGDGILALRGAKLTLTDAQVRNAARAGILFDASPGSVTRCEATRNRFGLVVQGAPQPTLGEGNRFQGNSEHGVVSGGTLPVPDAAPPIK